MTPKIDVQVRDAVEVAADPTNDRAAKIRENISQFDALFGTDEDAFDQPTTTRKELWSYYLYYNGDNGVGPLSYSQALYGCPVAVITQNDSLTLTASSQP